MKKQYFEIQLQQPVIISQTAASAGAHQSLDYIPGTLLLGLAASRLYAKLDPQQAWDIFHSGLVRFGDALPCESSGEISYPVPLCWHHFKGEKTVERGMLDKQSIFDVSKQDLAQIKTKQPVQLRSMYVTTTGRKVLPLREQTLKTAIDPNSGMAAESQLFGYEALAAGQIFRFYLSAPENFDQELWEKVTASMYGSAQLGRSRSAQFGKVLIKPASQQEQYTRSDQEQVLTLWLLSDLLLSQKGQPCLIPEPHLIGLPQDAVWLVDQSFVRTRRYSLYNAYRRHYDRERQVICRGSVLRYQLPIGVDMITAVNSLGCGIGLAQEQGLGHIWVNPAILAQRQPSFRSAAACAELDKQAVCRPERSLLIDCLERRNTALSQVHDPIEAAEKVFKQLCQKVTQVRRYLAVAQHTPLLDAPSRTQFGRLKELANNHRHQPSDLWKALADERDGMLRERSGWEIAFSPHQNDSLGRWLTDSLSEYNTQPWFPLLVGKLASLGLSDTWQKYCIGEQQ